MTSRDPNHYKSIFDCIASLNCTQESLEAIKKNYEDQINSKRRYHAINTLPELLQILEKRDVLNESDLTAFSFIANVCNDKAIKKLITHYNSDNPIPEKKPGTTPSRVLPEFIADKKERVYKLISNEIGDKWKDLARALDIPEGLIDELDKQYSSISRRMQEILIYHEEHNSRHWQTLLKEALLEARRNDLRKRVQNILDNCDD